MRAPVLLAFVGTLTLATPLLAQQAVGGIAGLVRDTQGAVLPGVVVEAASPVLIEKVRSVVTDGEGQFNIVDLRPGEYSVSFTLAGFSTLRREGIVLTAGFTATVNADLQVGALEETIVVTGAAPLVDTQNVRRQTVLSSELLDALPTSSKALGTLINLTPGLTGIADVGGSMGGYRAQGTPQLVQYHGRTGMKVNYDGMGILNMVGDGNTGYIMNALVVEEMVLESSGASAESASSGFAANAIPKEGGNRFSFSFNALGTTEGMVDDNLSDELRGRGLTTVDKVLNIYDYGITLGGPIKKDRLWFLASYRNWGNRNQIAGIFWNATQGTPFYTPDPNRPADRFEYFRSWAGRLTWQATPKNKLSVFADTQNNCSCRREGFIAPEAQASLRFTPQGLYQVVWSAPTTNRLLFEAGFGATISNWPTILPQPGVVLPDHVSIQELATGFRYNSAAAYNSPQQSDRYTQRGSVAYVTGSHALKFGFQLEEGISDVGQTVDLTYQFLNAVPNRVVQNASPYLLQNRVKADLGIFAQDQWTIKRLTLNVGVRYDYFNGRVPAQNLAATRFVAARSFDEVNGVPAWHDFNPRLGASYDLFGDGKTALKVSAARYVSKTGITIANENNPITAAVNSVTRVWTDANGNYKPDCDLANRLANGECGVVSNLNFGGRQVTTVWQDEVLRGFDARESNWDFTTEVQHELLPAVSISGGYYRSWFDHFRVTDNTALAPSDFTPYCITAPRDARLPGGGGYDVCGLYDVVPAKFGLVDNVVVQASRFGKQTRVADFFSWTINTRFGSGLRFGGGLDTGRIVTDRCFVVDSPQDLLYCRVVSPFSANTQLKFNGSYALPGDMVLSATFQNVAGIPIEANYAASTAEIAPSLGRNLAACGTRVVCTSTATVPLVAPQTMFEGRRSQVDFRFTKFVRMARARLQLNLDVYNLTNSSTLLGVNLTYGPQWRVPASGLASGQGVLASRMLQLSGRLTF